LHFQLIVLLEIAQHHADKAQKVIVLDVKQEYAIVMSAVIVIIDTPVVLKMPTAQAQMVGVIAMLIVHRLLLVHVKKIQDVVL